jgi:hypothetical protein
MASLDQLLTTPPAEIVAELKALRDQRTFIERKEALLEQTLNMIAEQGDAATADEIAALTVEAGVGSLREQILQVLQAKRGEGPFSMALVPKEVLNALADRGNRTVKLDNVRVTMKRMFDANELERPLPEYGLIYALPGTSDEHPEALALLAKTLKEGLSK